MLGSIRVPRIVRPQLFADDGCTEPCIADRQSQGMVEELVYIGKTCSIAVVLRIAAQIRIRILLTANVDRKGLMAVLQWPRRLQCDGAREPLTDETGVH